MALQLSDIYDSFEARKKDISDVETDLFANWMTAIAKFLYDQKRDIDPEQYTSNQLYTVSSEPQISALPTDFMGMQELGTGVYRLDADGKDSEDDLAITNFGSRQRGYYLDGSGNIVFTGISDGAQYRLRYIPKLPRFTAITDYFTLDKLSTGKPFLQDSDIEVLVDGLDVYYSRWDEDSSGEAMADQRWVRGLEGIFDKDRRNPLAISIPDFSDNF